MIQSNELTKELVQNAEKNGVLDKIYGEEVNRLLRKRYSASEEFALLWAMAEREKTEEVALFKAYREECKAVANAKIASLRG